jgi:regulator of replication initiation timing
MKDPFELIREKEQQILRLRQEIETLKVAVRLLSESQESRLDERKNDRRLLQMP